MAITSAAQLLLTISVQLAISRRWASCSGVHENSNSFGKLCYVSGSIFQAGHAAVINTFMEAAKTAYSNRLFYRQVFLMF